MRQSNHEGVDIRSTKEFPFYHFHGTHREIGQQHGEECAGLIIKHRDYALDRLEAIANLPSRQELAEAILHYRSYVSKHASFFDEEIQGIAEAAGISLADAYLLQLRAELYHDFEAAAECTTFAIAKESTADGTALIGQNADLPAFYSEIGIVAEFVPERGNACLMLTPAGQVSYIGINDKGMGVFANFLTCEGWRHGFPRYLFSRFALTKQSVNEAIASIRDLPRASSRNLIMLDGFGHIADMETTPTRDTILQPDKGLLVHANHYVGEDLLAEERLSGDLLENSRIRHERMKGLLEANRGKLDATVMQDILRDRATYPHTLCVIPGDTTYLTSKGKASDVITFASVIAQPEKRQLWIAVGPPNRYEYKRYTLSAQKRGE